MRPTKDEYFMGVARVVSSRATCDRKHVGAVITVGDSIVSTGYNGAPRGMPHCDDVGHDLRDMGGRQSCIRTAHAEANAIVNAARHGDAINGGTLYTTASPCQDCAKHIANAGISRVVYAEAYASRFDMGQEMKAFFNSVNILFEHNPG